MPPMTRSRAGKGDVPTALMASYYAQRASAGLIISEGTQISKQGQGYAWTPGIYSDEQIEGWKKVTDAVHQNDGTIFAQLWHVGRISHTSLQPDHQAPVSSSALSAEGVKVFIDPMGRIFGTWRNAYGEEATQKAKEVCKHTRKESQARAKVS